MVSRLLIQLSLLLLAALASAQSTAPVQTTRSPHGALTIPCQNCHTFSGWKPIRSAPEFDHSQTKYPLRGMHKNVACQECHVKSVFTNVGNKCADCHADIHRRQMGAECERCHSVNGWTVSLKSIREHQNRFPLIGAHAVVECDSCHKSAAAGQFQGLSTDCVSCHMNSYTRTKAPSHVALGFPTQCQQCHTTVDSWAGAKFDHAAFTGFALTGAHARLDCAACHVGGRYQGTPSNCVGCHAKDYAGAKDPDHVKIGFPQTCSQCHTTATWLGAKFDHSATGFVLTGAHATLSCSSCHTGALLTSANTTCVSCHLTDFKKTTNPNHALVGFPTECSSCHSTVNWDGAKFDHSTTGFTLTGAHATLNCSSCHSGATLTTANTTCVSCHLQDFQKTTNPNHVAGGFSQQCNTCHTTVSWFSASFDHNKTGFPLTGAHATTACTQCHVNGNYNLTSTACSTCHLTDFQKTTNPNHASVGFPTDCAQCHSTTNWLGATFNHATTGFPLTGAHATLACSSCHTGGSLSAANTNCVSCHLKDFQDTKNPNHVMLGFPQQCNSCHTTTAWQPASFNHSSTGFPLTGAHATAACTQCHINGNYNLTSTACATCHLTDYQKTTNPNHASVGFPTDCSVCHSTTNWLGAKFDHTTTGFPLTGAHATLACSSCHTGGSLSAANTNCVSCHLKDYQGTKNPNHVMLGFPQQCNSCHTTTAWQPATFNHSTTGFALTGAHATAACTQCHINGNYNLTSAACATCHLTDFQKTTNPNHASVGFPTDCSQCHNTTNWLGATFNHATTGFALTGAHATLACSSCHKGTPLTSANTACASCHLPDFQKTTNPNHVALAFPQQCDTCHTTAAWQPATFNHSTTGFALTGAHAIAACTQCHINGNYNLTSAACATCHLTDFQKTTNPNHASVGFPTDCSQCHTTASWAGATFNHATTGFALTGAHTTLACSSCHKGTPLTAANTACSSCHLPDFQKTTNPNHASVGFPTDCAQCHSTTSWAGATFNHATTGFALTGAHATLACSSCHKSTPLTAANAACASCHLTDYQKTTNPNHVAVAFPTDCSQCHTTTNWDGATFNHATTGFSLTGAHATLACSSCHAGTPLTAANAACASCHLPNYQKTTNPNHAAVGFPTDCSICHSTTNWQGATFNHATTGFALTGAHASLACSACHGNTPLTAANTTCVSCHLQNYNSATNPNHVSLQFPQQCDICHSTTAWQPATFNHNNTPFPLTGAHTSVPCANCHIGGKYAGTPTDCYSCHKADYTGVTNPNHAAAGFPTTCATCHTTTSWAGATFNHTWFPVPHKTAKLCSDCHTNPSDYSVFVCTNCHTQTQTTNEHKGVSGFVWNSTNCYACHKNGGGD